MVESPKENCWNDEEPVKAPNWDEVETRIEFRRHDLKARWIIWTRTEPEGMGLRLQNKSSEPFLQYFSTFQSAFIFWFLLHIV